MRTSRIWVALLALVVPLAAGCGGPKPPMRFDHPTKSGPPVPLAIYVHGGGWSAGSRVGDPYYISVRARLLAQGVAVASVDYRLAPKHRFPAPMVDVAYAVRYARSNAKKLRIDPDRIAAFGSSAGGHLASLLGTADASAGFDVGALKTVSSRVKAVVDLAGPVDLTDPSFPAVTDEGILKAFGVLGGTPGNPTLARGSPVTYVSAGDPPFLIIHGTADELVPVNQSVGFAQRLRSAGVRAELVTVVGGNHTLTAPGQNLTPAQITERISTFLVTELRR